MKDSSGRTDFFMINIKNVNIISMKTFSHRYLIKKPYREKDILIDG